VKKGFIKNIFELFLDIFGGKNVISNVCSK